MAASQQIEDYWIDASLAREEMKAAIVKFLCVLKDGWEADHIKLEPMSGGFVNNMWRCESNRDPENRLVVRIYPEPRLNYFSDTSTESNLLDYIASRVPAPKLITRFKNGLVYAYVEGRPLDPKDMLDDHIMGLVVQNARKLHELPIPGFLSGSLKAHSQRYQSLLLLDKLPEQLNSHRHQAWCQENLPCKQDLKKDVSICLAIFEDLTTRYPTVVVHNDMWSSNIVYNEKEDDVVILDWETGSSGVVPFEFAVLLENWLGESMTEDFKRKWIKIYLTGSSSGSESSISDEVLELWYQDTVKACMMTQFGMVMFGLTLLEKDPPSNRHNVEGLMNFCLKCYEKYNTYAKELPHLTSS